MNKKFNKILVLVLFLILIPYNTVLAADFTVATSKSTVEPNGTFTVSMNLSGAGRFKVTVINGTISGNTDFYYPAEHQNLTVKAGGSGEVTVTYEALNASTSSEVRITGQKVSKTVKIAAAPPKPTPPPTTPNPKPKPNPTPIPTPPPSTGIYDPKPQVESEVDRIKREEAEKIKQEENLKNTPLIDKIELFSESKKRNGQSVAELKTEYAKFDYDITTPSFINEIKLQLTPHSKDVKFEFEEKHLIEGKKTIVLKASTDAVSQTFNLTVNSTDVSSIKNGDRTVYSDPLVDTKMKEFGFVKIEVGEEQNLLYFYNLEELNLQMFVNSDHEAYFGLLSETGEVLEEGQVIIIDGKLAFISNSEDELIVNKTLYSKGYDYISISLPSFVKEIDESLLPKQNIKGWTYDDGQVIYLKGDDQYLSIYDDVIRNAVVAFDKEDDSSKLLSLASSVAFPALLATNLAYIAVKYIKKKKYDM